MDYPNTIITQKVYFVKTFNLKNLEAIYSFTTE
jgi:hypothetical protein